MLIFSHTIRKAHMSHDTDIYIFLAEFGLYDKYKEIDSMSMSENIISGNGDKFNQNDFAIDTKEGRKSYQDLSEHSQESFYNSSGIDQGCSSPIIHYKSSGTCKFLLRFLQQKIVCLKEKMNYQSVITLNTKLRTELT